MSESALYEFFTAMSAWQLRRARTWVSVSGEGSNDRLLLLFDYLVQCAGKGKLPDFDAAIRCMWNKGGGSLPQLRRDMSDLSNIMRNFLIWQETNSLPGHKEWLLVRAIRKLGLEKNYQLAVREAEATINHPQNQGIDKFLWSFRLGHEQFQWEVNRKRDQELSVESLLAEMDAWYAGQSLQLACLVQSQKNVRNQNRMISPHLNELLALMPEKPHERIPSIAIYHQGHRMLAEPENETHVEIYKTMLAHQVETGPPAEMRDLLTLAINHGIRRINAGERTAIRQTLGFYLLGLEKKLLHDEGGKLSKFTYNNVLMTFLALEEWEQAKAFLEKYRVELYAKEQENIYQYNLAIYHFRRNEYDAALELLRDVTLPDPMYKLESRKMLLKIYYEQEATIALESLLENMLVWLRRHSELGYHREMYRNLARFTTQLLRLPPNAPEERKRLKKKVLETQLVAERAWLLEKIGS
ncbi:MAG: hypothetical protein JNJ57_12110 [Saprospiraceae bacterium]|nr:hypothetical protein [Saprospiraceae bacterium]